MQCLTWEACTERTTYLADPDTQETQSLSTLTLKIIHLLLIWMQLIYKKLRTVSHTETAENPAPILIQCFMGIGNGEHLEIWGRGLLQYINSKWLFPVKLTVGLNHFLLLQFAIEPFCKFSLKNFSFQVDTGKATVFATLLLEHIFYIHDSSVLIIILNVFSNWSPNLL